MISFPYISHEQVYNNFAHENQYFCFTASFMESDVPRSYREETGKQFYAAPLFINPVIHSKKLTFKVPLIRNTYLNKKSSSRF